MTTKRTFSDFLTAVTVDSWRVMPRTGRETKKKKNEKRKVLFYIPCLFSLAVRRAAYQARETQYHSIHLTNIRNGVQLKINHVANKTKADNWASAKDARKLPPRISTYLDPGRRAVSLLFESQ